MIGSIVGDIVGSKYEFDNNKSKFFLLFDDDCSITDDSILSLAIAKALIESKTDFSDLSDNAIKYMREFGKSYLDFGYGARFYDWLCCDCPKPYNSFGNGSAMRISAVGWVASDIKQAKYLSRKVTEVTHNHAQGIKGAEAVAVAIVLARQGKTKIEIQEYVNKHYYKTNFTLSEIRESYKFNETCQCTVPQAFRAFFESVDFEDAIRNAISIGGDSDTLACITGSIAEAYYGIPDIVRNTAEKYLDKNLLAVLKKFENKYNFILDKRKKHIYN